MVMHSPFTWSVLGNRLSVIALPITDHRLLITELPSQPISRILSY